MSSALASHKSASPTRPGKTHQGELRRRRCATTMADPHAVLGTRSTGKGRHRRICTGMFSSGPPPLERSWHAPFECDFRRCEREATRRVCDPPEWPRVVRTTLASLTVRFDDHAERTTRRMGRIRARASTKLMQRPRAGRSRRVLPHTDSNTRARDIYVGQRGSIPCKKKKPSTSRGRKK